MKQSESKSVEKWRRRSILKTVDGRTTDATPWHKLIGSFEPDELKIVLECRIPFRNIIVYQKRWLNRDRLKRVLFRKIFPDVYTHSIRRCIWAGLSKTARARVQLPLPLIQGPVSQRVTINRTLDIHHSSMENHVHVLIKLGINRNSVWNGTQIMTLNAHYSILTQNPLKTIWFCFNTHFP